MQQDLLLRCMPLCVLRLLSLAVTLEGLASNCTNTRAWAQADGECLCVG